MALPYRRAEVKERARAEWVGACNVTLPSFTEDFRGLNEAGIRHDVELAAQYGYWGTLVASESGTTTEEYKRFLEVTAEAAPEGFKLVAHLSFSTVEEAIEVARVAEGVGAEAALLSYPPSFRPKSSAEIVEHTRYVAEQTDIALILFGVATWGFKPLHPAGFPMDALLEISKLETAAALKYEGGGPALFSAFDEVHDLCHEHLIVENPMEQHIPGLVANYGIRWFGTSGYEAFGPRVPQVLEAALAGDRARTSELFWSYHAGREAKGQFHATFAGAHLIHRVGWKYLGWLQGFNGGLLRMPQMRLQPGQMRALRGGLAASGFELPADDAEFYTGRRAA
ncbi:MAG TPA: dihydrodipicolinate synthase family protein [Conexibacter sp.]|jgi:4-hydroxy-tetrahydrodipicolinate synthase